jgi:hypothetical protein
MSIKVRATTRGYYGGVVREAGDVFEVETKEHVGSWMDPAVEEKGPAKEPAKGGKGKGGKAADATATKGNAEQNGDAQGDTADLA